MSKDRRLRIGIGIGVATYVAMAALFPGDSFARAGRVFIVIALAYMALKGRNWARILLGVWFALIGAAAILASFAGSSAGNGLVAILMGGGFVASAFLVLTGRRETVAVPEQDRVAP